MRLIHFALLLPLWTTCVAASNCSQSFSEFTKSSWFAKKKVPMDFFGHNEWVDVFSDIKPDIVLLDKIFQSEAMQRLFAQQTHYAFPKNQFSDELFAFYQIKPVNDLVFFHGTSAEAIKKINKSGTLILSNALGSKMRLQKNPIHSVFFLDTQKIVAQNFANIHGNKARVLKIKIDPSILMADLNPGSLFVKWAEVLLELRDDDPYKIDLYESIYQSFMAAFPSLKTLYKNRFEFSKISAQELALLAHAKVFSFTAGYIRGARTEFGLFDPNAIREIEVIAK